MPLPGALRWYDPACISSSVNKRGEIFLPNHAGMDLNAKADDSKNKLYPAAAASFCLAASSPNNK